MIPTPLQHGQLTSAILLTQNLGCFFCFPAIHVLREGLTGSQSQNSIQYYIARKHT